MVKAQIRNNGGVTPPLSTPHVHSSGLMRQIYSAPSRARIRRRCRLRKKRGDCQCGDSDTSWTNGQSSTTLATRANCSTTPSHNRARSSHPSHPRAIPTTHGARHDVRNDDHGSRGRHGRDRHGSRDHRHG